MGPNSREHLQRICNEDISNETLPFGFSKKINLGGTECRLHRITYVGELGFEIYIPYNNLGKVFDVVYAKWKEPSKTCRLSCTKFMRMEKGYLHWGA